MKKEFTYYEQILEAIHLGVFNEVVSLSHNGTDRAIMNYLYNNKCSFGDVARVFDISEKEVKERVLNFIKYYEKINELVNHESFRKKGR